MKSLSYPRHAVNSLGFPLAVILTLVMFFRPVPGDASGELLKQIAIILPVIVSAYILLLYLLTPKPVGNKLFEGFPGLFFISLVLFSVLISLLYNISNMSMRGIAELIRPLYYFIIFIFFYLLAQPKLVNFFVKFLIVFAIVQIIISTLQLIYPPISEAITFFYSTEKMHKGLFRLVGTLGNPNRLGMYVTCGMLATRVSMKKNLFYLSYPLFTFGVFLSGSLFSLGLFSFLFFIFIFSDLFRIIRRSYLYLAAAFIIMPITLALIYYGVISLIELHPRLSAILHTVKSPEHLLKVGDWSLRVYAWKIVYYKFSLLADTNPLLWLLGAGPRKETLFRALDNDYLLVFFRYGALGLTLYLSGITYLFCLSLQRKKEPLFRLCKYVIFLLSISSFFYETYSSWMYIPLYVPLFAMMVAESKKPEGRALNEPAT